MSISVSNMNTSVSILSSNVNGITQSGGNISINTSGNVGIGKSNPSYKLDVNGVLHTSTNTISTLLINEYNDSASVRYWKLATLPANNGSSLSLDGNFSRVDDVCYIGFNVNCYTNGYRPYSEIRSLIGNYSGRILVYYNSTVNKIDVFVYASSWTFAQFKLNCSSVDNVYPTPTWTTTAPVTSGTYSLVHDSSVNSLINTTHSGNVGIGKSNPSYKLDVSGDINFTGNIYKNNSLFSSGGGSSQWSSSGANIYVGYGSNVGINTSSPAYALDVFGTGMRLQGGTGTTPTVFYLNPTGSGTTTSIMQFVNSGHQIVCTDSNTYAGVPSIGSGHNIYYMSGGHNFSGKATFKDNVGIGTNSPTYNLDIMSSGYTNVRIGTTSTAPSYNTIRMTTGVYSGSSARTNSAWEFGLLQAGNGSSATSDRWYVGRSGISDSDFCVSRDGYVGIGNSSPSYILDVSGTARFTGGYTTSDAREKKNIEPVNTQDSENIIRQLQVKSYNWLTEDSNVAHHIGWIAQDVQAVIPSVVSTDKEGKLSISYGEIQAHMCGALQQVLQKIDSLQAQNADLLERLNRLESLITQPQ